MDQSVSLGIESFFDVRLGDELLAGAAAASPVGHGRGRSGLPPPGMLSF